MRVSLIDSSEITKLEETPDKHYKLAIIAFQWHFRVIDLEKKAQLINAGEEESTARAEAELLNRIQLQSGSTIEVTFYTRDVQHGLKIDEIDFKLVSNRPGPEEVLGVAAVGILEFPKINEKYRAYSYIFSGLGTDDMEIWFYTGDWLFITPSYIYGILIVSTLALIIKILTLTKKTI
ncbi:MAG: hypothetical protein IH840_15280 [Candidatus Heimdallarchaeota archaeon]|nr:hypothetical protein [Candidatus Heimdallarchaeota archaeon]